MGTPFGRYELLRKIAAGGMAEIFLGRRWGAGGFFNDVVIKRLFRHLAEHDRTLEMFQYEARLLSELCHPNIPQVFELGFEDGHWFMAMEYIKGYTVADAWRAGARAGHVMPMPVAVGVVMQACEALHHAHERRDRAGRQLRIVHRDVTPHNIMLTHDGVAKVMDFGVAQTAARRDTEAGAVKGTFSYMAPEQVRAKPLDRRADVFALGVILYELTTGTRLFRGNDVQVMTAVVETDAPPPSSRVPGFPEDLEEIVLASLSRDRKRRLPSASHLALALEDFAMRNGLLVGPRAVARWVGNVYPYTPEKEAELAMVEAPRLEVVPDADGSGDWAVVEPGAATTTPGSGEWATSFDPDYATDQGVDLDDPAMLDDLALLDPSVVEGGYQPSGPTPVVPPGDMLEPLELPEADPADVIDVSVDVGAFDEAIFDDTTAEGLRTASDDEDLAPLTGFEDEASQPQKRPVVLLESKKREEDDEGAYLSDLERRLEEDAD